MKKFIVAALAAAVAATSFVGVADARDRGRGFEWRHQGHNGHNWRHTGFRGWHGRHYGWRHNGWRGPGYWGPGWGYWGGPTIVIGGPAYYEDYCFLKKVRRYDQFGNMYIKRIRVCR